jgi:long-subunit acyl-CoA synthetase (AMP-forming)
MGGVKVGICATNRVEWLIADFACAFNSYSSVGIHTTWPVDV